LVLIHWASLYLSFCSILIALYRAPTQELKRKKGDLSTTKVKYISNILRASTVFDLTIQVVQTMKLLESRRMFLFADRIDIGSISSLLSVARILSANLDNSQEAFNRNPVFGQSSESVRT
jgi:hypothetical protein